MLYTPFWRKSKRRERISMEGGKFLNESLGSEWVGEMQGALHMRTEGRWVCHMM